MRFLVLFAAPALALAGLAAGCATIPGSPAEVADKTTLDERGLLGAELAYEAARTVAEISVDAGLIRGETASRVAVADERVYQALRGARAAYEAGNAADYFSAVDRARKAAAELLALAKGDSS